WFSETEIGDRAGDTTSRLVVCHASGIGCPALRKAKTRFAAGDGSEAAAKRRWGWIRSGGVFDGKKEIAQKIGAGWRAKSEAKAGPSLRKGRGGGGGGRSSRTRA